MFLEIWLTCFCSYLSYSTTPRCLIHGKCSTFSTWCDFPSSDNVCTLFSYLFVHENFIGRVVRFPLLEHQQQNSYTDSRSIGFYFLEIKMFALNKHSVHRLVVARWFLWTLSLEYTFGTFKKTNHWYFARDGYVLNYADGAALWIFISSNLHLIWIASSTCSVNFSFSRVLQTYLALIWATFDFCAHNLLIQFIQTKEVRFHFRFLILTFNVKSKLTWRLVAKLQWRTTRNLGFCWSF